MFREYNKIHEIPKNLFVWWRDKMQILLSNHVPIVPTVIEGISIIHEKSTARTTLETRADLIKAKTLMTDIINYRSCNETGRLRY